jgi:predicted amidohydrolase
MLGLGLRYARIGIGICWDWDMPGLELGLGYARIGIGIC